MSGGHGNEGHGGGHGSGSGGSNVIGECITSYCDGAKKGGNGIADMVYTTFLGIFGGGGGDGGGHDHGHH